MLMIAQREEGRLKQEVRKLEKELEEFKEKKNVFEVLFFNFMVLIMAKHISIIIILYTILFAKN